MAYDTVILQLGIMALLAKVMNNYNWKPYWPAFLSVALPFVYTVFLGVIKNVSLGQLLSVPVILLLLCQYAAALVVFKLLDVYQDTIVLWLAWMLGGGIVIFLIIPAIIEKFV